MDLVSDVSRHRRRPGGHERRRRGGAAHPFRTAVELERQINEGWGPGRQHERKLNLNKKSSFFQRKRKNVRPFGRGASKWSVRGAGLSDGRLPRGRAVSGGGGREEERDLSKLGCSLREAKKYLK